MGPYENKENIGTFDKKSGEQSVIKDRQKHEEKSNFSTEDESFSLASKIASFEYIDETDVEEDELG